MNQRADGVVVAHPLFQAGGGGSTPTSALDLFFFRCDRDLFQKCNQLWHSRLPKICVSFGRVYYAAEYRGDVFAVAMWSNPVARLLPQNAWLELRRFAIRDAAPKNTASRMLGWMVRDIKRSMPEIERLISYQDCDAHVGTIYRASGWKPAEGYVSRSRGWAPGAGGGNRLRVGRTNQAVSPRVRWELTTKPTEHKA